MRKINEDIEQGEYLADLPEEAYDYMSKATLDGEDFYIIWDMESIMSILNTDDREVTENILSDVLGDNWGYEDDWRMCDICGKALYYYDGDYWSDYDNGYTTCSDCIATNRENAAGDYVNHLVNDYHECNQFIPDEKLIAMGWHKLEGVYANDYYGRSDSPREIMDSLLNEHPHNRFIFSSESSGPWGTSWSVWTDSMLEEEKSDEER